MDKFLVNRARYSRKLSRVPIVKIVFFTSVLILWFFFVKGEMSFDAIVYYILVSVPYIILLGIFSGTNQNLYIFLITSLFVVDISALDKTSIFGFKIKQNSGDILFLIEFFSLLLFVILLLFLLLRFIIRQSQKPS